MDQDFFSRPQQDESEQLAAAKAEADRLDAAARHITELALLEARVQIARSCGA